MSIISTNSIVADTTTLVASDGIEFPTQIAAGVSYAHGSKWTVGLDYTLQKWADAKFPLDQSNGYVAKTGVFNDSHKINAGFEYCKNAEGRKADGGFFSRIRYRVGAGYSTPYIKIGEKDGPSQLSVSAGVGIPIVNAINNRSMLNVSAQWVRNDASGFIKENTFRINVGFTFNERWFAKWKFE